MEGKICQKGALLQRPSLDQRLIECIAMILKLVRRSFISSPEPKAQVSYCHSAPSVVRPFAVRRPSVWRKLSHFWLLLWNRWTEFNETWQEARSQRPLPSLCFSGRLEKQDDRSGLWLAETFSTSSLKPLNIIQRNLTGSKIATPSTKFVFFGPIEKTRWPPWPLIGWYIFDFSSETAERNSTKLDRKQDLNALYQFGVFRANRKKRCPPWPLIGWDISDFSSETTERNSLKLDRKQDLNVLYQVCVFSGRSEKQDGRPGLWLTETFSTSPLKPLNRIQQNLIGSKISKPSTKFVFFGRIGKTRWPPRPLIGWDIFDFSVETAERNSTNLERKQDLNALYKVCVFRKNKMGALASDKLRYFRLLLWNRWMEFNETWQESWSKRPLPSLCFSGRSEKQDGRPGLWLTETFSTSPLKPQNRIQWNLIGSKISTPSTKFVFFGPIGKTKWPPWPLIGWDIFDFSSETAERNSAKLDRKQALNAVYHVCVFQANRRKNKMAALASDWLRHFRLLWNCERNPTKLDRKQDLNALYQVCVFQVDQKNKMAVLAYDLLRHFQFFLWNRWIEFNRTWQEARFQHPLPGLRFSGWSEIR